MWLGCGPARALTGASVAAPGAFAHVGAVGGTSGVLVAPNWVLTAAHVGAVGSTFASALGSGEVAAKYTFPGAGTRHNDIGLLYLKDPIAWDAAFPRLNGVALEPGAVPDTTQVTLTSARSAMPGRPAYGTARLVAVVNTLREGNVTTTPNWLVTGGTGVHVEGGDSGGGLFYGAVDDSLQGVLLGVASVAIRLDGSTVVSGVVQVAPYRAWIDGVIALHTPGQSVTWAAASPVPEPATAGLFLAGWAMLAVILRRQRGRCRSR